MGVYRMCPGLHTGMQIDRQEGSPIILFGQNEMMGQVQFYRLAKAPIKDVFRFPGRASDLVVAVWIYREF